MSFCGLRVFSLLPKFISLELSANCFQFNSSTLQHLLQSPNLRELSLENHNLSWFKPTYLNISSSLRFLNLKYTGLNGNWPYNILNLQHLEHLDLYGNFYNGPWPKTKTTIPLKSLNLGLNSLSGEIPKSFGYLRFLTYLNLFQRNLVGSLPKTIAKLHHLEHINLAHNKLNGTIPFGLFSLPSLEEFIFISTSSLEGYHPMWYFVKGLVLLDLSNNKLNGSFNLYALLSSLPHLGTLNFINSGLIVTDDYTGRPSCSSCEYIISIV